MKLCLITTEFQKLLVYLFHGKPNPSIRQEKEIISFYHIMILYMHTHCIYIQNVSLVVQLGKKKSENLNTVCKESERVVKSSIVCVLHSFHAVKGSHYVQRVFWPDFKIIQASSNHQMSNHGSCSHKCSIQLAQMHHQLQTQFKILDFCVFTKLQGLNQSFNSTRWLREKHVIYTFFQEG